MPKTFYISPEHSNSGISVEYIKTKRDIYISGWYDDFVGIEGERMGLDEFFNRLGITEKDCAAAFRKMNS